MRTYSFLLARGSDSSELDRHQDVLCTCAGRLVDLFLLLRAGIPASIGVDAWSRKIVALSWFPVEDADGPREPFVPGTERLVSVDVLEELKQALEHEGIPENEISTWVRDCSPALRARYRDDALRINRRRMWRAASLGLTQDECLEFVKFLHTDFFQQPKPDEEEDNNPSSVENRYIKFAGHLWSQFEGTGKKTDWGTLKNLCQRALSRLGDQDDFESPGDFKSFLAESAGMSVDDVDALLNFGSPSKLKHLLKEDAASHKKLTKEKIAEALGDRVDAATRRLGVLSLADDGRGAALLRRAFTSSKVFSKTVAIPVLGAAVARAFGGHTQVLRSELQRSKDEAELASLLEQLNADPASEILAAYVQTRSDELGSYSLRRGAVRGWEDLRKVIRKKTTAEERVRAVREAQASAEKFGDAALFEFLALPENQPCWKILDAFVEAASLRTIVARRKVACIRHISDKSPVWMTFGEQRWPCEVISADSHGIRVRLALGGHEETEFSFKSKWAVESLGLDVETGALHPGRRDSVGRSVDAPGRALINGAKFHKLASVKLDGKRTSLLKLSSDDQVRAFAEWLRESPPAMSVRKDRRGQWRLDCAVSLTCRPNSGSAVLGLDVGLTRPAAIAVLRPSDPPPATKTIEHTDVDGTTLSVVGEVDGRVAVWRQAGSAWFRLDRMTVLTPSPKVRRVSREEHRAVVDVVQRSKLRVRVPTNVLEAQKILVRACAIRLRSHSRLARVSHLLRAGHTTSALRLWQQAATDPLSADFSEKLWRRTFGCAPTDAPTLPPATVLAKAADTFASEWENQESCLAGDITFAENWAVPRAASPATRHVGGDGHSRLLLLEQVARLSSSWHWRMRPEGPLPRVANEATPERIARIQAKLASIRDDRCKKMASEIVQAAFGNDTRPRCARIVHEALDMGRSQTQTRANNRTRARLSPSSLFKEIAQNASLQGIDCQQCSPAYTSQVDYATGLPALRCEEVSVERFVFNGAGQHKRFASREELAYLAALHGCWDAERKLWTTPAGSWSWQGYGPGPRWKGPGGQPPPVTVPARRGGSLLLCERPGRERLARLNADLAAAVNIALRSLTWQWCWASLTDRMPSEFRARQKALLRRLVHEQTGDPGLQLFVQVLDSAPEATAEGPPKPPRRSKNSRPTKAKATPSRCLKPTSDP